MFENLKETRDTFRKGVKERKADLSPLEMARFLIGVIRPLRLSSLSMKEFEIIQDLVEDCYLLAKRVTREGPYTYEEKKAIRAHTLALKLGGKIPVEWLLEKENNLFWKFITANYLQHTLFALRIQVPFDPIFGPELPFEWKEEGPLFIPWGQLDVQFKQHGGMSYYMGKKELFEVDVNMTLLPCYQCMYKGIAKYDPNWDPIWRPYDKQNPKEWGGGYLLEIWTMCDITPEVNPSMFRKTHAFSVLKDAQGYVRSVGQDIIVTVQDYGVTEILSRKKSPGKILTPDQSVFYPRNARQFRVSPIKITKAQFEKIIAIVEEDKKNENHTMSVLRGNCVSYVLKLLQQGLGINLDASMHGVHIFAKSILPHKLYKEFIRRFNPWYEKRSDPVKKALFFFPLFYIPHLFVGLVASALKQKNHEDKADFYLKDILVRPWTLSCDHPLQLHRILSSGKHTLSPDEEPKQ